MSATASFVRAYVEATVAERSLGEGELASRSGLSEERVRSFLEDEDPDLLYSEMENLLAAVGCEAKLTLKKARPEASGKLPPPSTSVYRPEVGGDGATPQAQPVAVIGVAEAIREYVGAIMAERGMNEEDLVALCDLSRERVQCFLQDGNNALWYSDVEDLLGALGYRARLSLEEIELEADGESPAPVTPTYELGAACVG